MPETKTTIIPHLTCRNCHEAIEFYQKAFGATVQGVMDDKQGRVMHASILIDGNPIYLHDEMPEWNALGPQNLPTSPVTIHLQVPNVDEVFQKAADAGCEVKMPVEDQFWGDRYGTLKDPYGHSWSVATTVREVSREEIAAALESF